jgi:hypothetical protein
MIVVPHVIPVAVAVCALSVGAWQWSAATTGAGTVLDALMISMLVLLQNTSPLRNFFGVPKSVITI